jgi:hypothetical protein
MRVREALVSGIGAGIAMTLATWLAGRVAPCTDMPMIWGTMLLPAGDEAWLLGLVIHLLVAALVGLVYAFAFEHVTHGASAWTGVLFSLAHSLVAGIALGLLPRVHPRIPQAMPEPGWLALGYGVWGLVVLIAVHAVYGAFVGATYGTVRQPARNVSRRAAA